MGLDNHTSYPGDQGVLGTNKIAVSVCYSLSKDAEGAIKNLYVSTCYMANKSLANKVWKTRRTEF